MQLEDTETPSPTIGEVDQDDTMADDTIPSSVAEPDSGPDSNDAWSTLSHDWKAEDVRDVDAPDKMPDNKYLKEEQKEGTGGDASLATQTETQATHASPSLRDRLPIVLGIVAVVCLIISAVTFGLQWMARHGGGTGDPVEASSDIDNTPIPIPHVESIGMINLSFPEGMALTVSMGEQVATWDGTSIAGTMPVEIAGSTTGTTVMTLPVPQGASDLLVNFTNSTNQPFLSFSVAMTTKEIGALTVTGTMNNLPVIGTARINPSDCIVGIACAETSAATTPVINISTSYTVGDGNADYAGAYVSTNASLTLGQDMREAYLTANTRNVSVSSPEEFGHGGLLQTSRTTIRQSGQQNNIMGTVMLPESDKDFSGLYEELAENDESKEIMGRDVSRIAIEEADEKEASETSEQDA